MKRTFLKRKNNDIPAGNSLFVETWLILGALFFLTTLLFFVSANRTENEHRRTVACQTNLELLQSTSDLVTLGMENIREDIAAVIWNTDFVNYFMDPGRADAQRGYRIAQAFGRIKRANAWIGEMWAMSSLTQDVIAQDGSVWKRDEFAAGVVPALTSGDFEPSAPEDPSRNAEPVLYGGKLYWVVPFVTNRPVGSVCAAVDMQVLSERIAGRSRGPVGLYDKNGTLLVPQGAEHGFPKRIDPGAAGTFATHAGDDPRKADWYRVDDPVLGLTYLKPIDRAAFSVPLYETLLSSLPVLLVLLLVSLCGSGFLAARIYRPINYLVRRVLAHSAAGLREARNEVDALELSFFRTLRQNEDMQGKLRYFARENREKTFRLLLHGRTAEEAGLAYLDDEAQDTWRDGRPMCVLACRRTGESIVSDTGLDASLFHVTVADAVAEIEGVSCQAVPMGTCLDAVLICPDTAETAEDALLALRAAEEKLRAVFAPSGWEVAYGESPATTALGELAYCWEEARRRMDYRVYLASATNAFPEETAEAESAERDPGVWERIPGLILSAPRERVDAELGDLIAAFLNTEPSDAALADFVNGTAERITAALPEERSADAGCVPAVTGETFTGMTAEERLARVLGVLEPLRLQAEASADKKGNRYVEDAMEYIREHYGERDLGVQDVADHLGITANYFSTLFHETTGDSFVNRLNGVRVEQAARLLKETKLPIGDIGFRCGFNTVQHFNRTFKKVTGMPPGKYRTASAEPGEAEPEGEEGPRA
ncbi:MAG: AraC family transcriptional regulator [Clostridia bacterium]|nr:AraC family transcriptional regulator [Clostridia bacterium]